MRLANIILIIITTILIPASNLPPLAHGLRALIVDTDMGLDDARALFAILADKEIDVIGIVLTEGSASEDCGLENLSKLLSQASVRKVPIFRGTSFSASVPWRNKANSLGGYSSSWENHSPLALHELEELCALIEREDRVSYLALGPLGSLSTLLRDGKSLQHLSEIIVPVKLRGEHIEAWNLDADREATKSVFDRARNIVLVDVEIEEGHLQRLAYDLSGKTAASSFAKSTLGARSENEQHSFLYDELAAIYAARPELSSVGEERFRLKTGKTLSIAREQKGNMRIASFRDAKEAILAIENLWEASGGREALQVERALIEKLKEFHGHLGPYVVLGYRMGRLALEATGSAGYFDISAEIHSALEPPRSCLVDGVQLGAGCTLGKRNIEIVEEKGPAYGIFASKSGVRASVRLLANVPERVDSLIAVSGVEEAGRAILAAPIDELFSVEIEK